MAEGEGLRAIRAVGLVGVYEDDLDQRGFGVKDGLGAVIVVVDGHCAVAVPDQLLAQRHAESLGDGALHLASGRELVDDSAAVVRGNKA